MEYGVFGIENIELSVSGDSGVDNNSYTIEKYTQHSYVQVTELFSDIEYEVTFIAKDAGDNVVYTTTLSVPVHTN